MPTERIEPNAIPRALTAWGDHTTTGLRRFRRMAQRVLRSEPPRLTVDVAHRLERLSSSGSHLVACELLDDPRIRPVLTAEDISAVARLDSWSSVDIFAVYVLGPAWRDGRVDSAFLEEWALHEDRWHRRAALVATVALNCKARGGTGDAQRTVGICRFLIEDRDDMVVKAMSWALRELAKREPEAAEGFLREYGQRLAPRVRREVTRKLTTGTKSGRSTARRTP